MLAMSSELLLIYYPFITWATLPLAAYTAISRDAFMTTSHTSTSIYCFDRILIHTAPEETVRVQSLFYGGIYEGVVTHSSIWMCKYGLVS